jgi:hypothetical protein
MPSNKEPKEPEEPELVSIINAFDRIIEQARTSLLEDKVNVFDQHKVNSFLPCQSSKWLLLHKLQKDTYKKYKKVWKQLLCFVYRLAWKKQGLALHYTL